MGSKNKGSIGEVDFPELTPKQRDVYDLFYNQGFTITSIANSRKITYNAVRKTIKQLIKKGAIETGFKQGSKKEMPIIMTPQQIEQFVDELYFRLHGLHFIVTPYYFYERYNSVKRGFGVPFANWKFTFNTKNIEVQSERGYSFDSKDMDECMRLCQDSLTEILLKAGTKYGFEVFKEGRVSIRLVNHHLAEVRNGIAVMMQGKKLKIEGKDGKVWLTIDNSTKDPELETIDPLRALDDSRILRPYFEDMRDNHPPTNSEINQNLATTTKLVNTFVETKEGLEKNIMSHLELLRRYTKNIMIQDQKNIRKLKDKASQTNLRRWNE
jgi:ASC-1-like (ASCH) protein